MFFSEAFLLLKAARTLSSFPAQERHSDEQGEQAMQNRGVLGTCWEPIPSQKLMGQVTSLGVFFSYDNSAQEELSLLFGPTVDPNYSPSSKAQGLPGSGVVFPA